LWTLPRVAVVVERLSGVRYHPGHVWKILGSIDWTLQRPARRAKERNPEKGKRWVDQRWPEVKKRLAAGKPGSSSKTKVVFPSVPRSDGPGRQEEKHRS
jgi:hypothetical protein